MLKGCVQDAGHCHSKELFDQRERFQSVQMTSENKDKATHSVFLSYLGMNESLNIMNDCSQRDFSKRNKFIVVSSKEYSNFLVYHDCRGTLVIDDVVAVDGVGVCVVCFWKMDK